MSTVLVQAGTAVRPLRPARPLRLVEPLPGRAVPASQTPAAVAPLRLTRRGRVAVRVLVVLLGLVVTAVVVLTAGRSAKADAAAHPVEVGYHVVAPGETLWQIAGEVAPGVDRRDTVASIVELNALRTEQLAAGDRIAVPVRH
jgi:hypothetical protein